MAAIFTRIASRGRLLRSLYFTNEDISIAATFAPGQWLIGLAIGVFAVLVLHPLHRSGSLVADRPPAAGAGILQRHCVARILRPPGDLADGSARKR